MGEDYWLNTEMLVRLTDTCTTTCARLLKVTPLNTRDPWLNTSSLLRLKLCVKRLLRKKLELEELETELPEKEDNKELTKRERLTWLKEPPTNKWSWRIYLDAIMFKVFVFVYLVREFLI